MEIKSNILDGKWLAKQFHKLLKTQCNEAVSRYGRAPGLGVVLVGDNPASKAYVGTKERVAKKCGFKSKQFSLPESAGEEKVISTINTLNQDEEIDGILLQLPVPERLSKDTLISSIDPKKDADGLHPVNQGLLMQGNATVYPCTPLGILKLLDVHYAEDISIGDDLTTDLPECDLSGKQALVIGRSILVGKPLALMLLERNATITAAHSRTKNLPALCKQADIVIAAVGKPGIVKSDWLSESSVVIDVGINRLDDGSLVGDIEFEGTVKKVSAITPVPGGVGPMTVAMLMNNTLTNFKQRVGWH